MCSSRSSCSEPLPSGSNGEQEAPSAPEAFEERIRCMSSLYWESTSFSIRVVKLGSPSGVKLLPFTRVAMAPRLAEAPTGSSAVNTFWMALA